MLNDLSDWTDQFDSGCKVDDEDLSAAYRMIRLAGFDLYSLKYCGVKDLPDGPLQNYHICCPTSGKNGSWKQPPCFTPAQKSPINPDTYFSLPRLAWTLF